MPSPLIADILREHARQARRNIGHHTTPAHDDAPVEGTPWAPGWAQPTEEDYPRLPEHRPVPEPPPQYPYIDKGGYMQWGPRPDPFEEWLHGPPLEAPTEEIRTPRPWPPSLPEPGTQGTFTERLWNFLNLDPSKMGAAEMPTGPAGTPARRIAKYSGQMRLVGAARILGVTLGPSRVRTTPNRPGGGVIPAEERWPGGPDYIYETAKAAYRQRVVHAHPDKGGSEAEMKLLNEAWDFIQKHYGPMKEARLSNYLRQQDRRAPQKNPQIPRNIPPLEDLPPTIPEIP